MRYFISHRAVYSRVELLRLSPIPPRSASYHSSRRRRDQAADVEPTRAVILRLGLRAVMFSPCRCAHSRSS
jgi:hypothetical protein